LAPDPEPLLPRTGGDSDLGQSYDIKRERRQVIETKDSAFTPDLCSQWLSGRLPQPVGDPEAWSLGDGSG
jgi:hypothetical protein